MERMRIMLRRTVFAFLSLYVADPQFVAAQSGVNKLSIARTDVRELPAAQPITQALNQLTFGPKPGDAQKVRAIGLQKWMDKQLHPERINDSFVDQLIDKYPALNAD